MRRPDELDSINRIGIGLALTLLAATACTSPAPAAAPKTYPLAAAVAARLVGSAPYTILLCVAAMPPASVPNTCRRERLPNVFVNFVTPSFMSTLPLLRRNIAI